MVSLNQKTCIRLFKEISQLHKRTDILAEYQRRKNIIVHNCGKIQLDRMWMIIVEDLPPSKPFVMNRPLPNTVKMNEPHIVAHSFSYIPCTAVVMSNTPSGSFIRRLVRLLMISYSSFKTKSSVYRGSSTSNSQTSRYRRAVSASSFSRWMMAATLCPLDFMCASYWKIRKKRCRMASLATPWPIWAMLSSIISRQDSFSSCSAYCFIRST